MNLCACVHPPPPPDKQGSLQQLVLQYHTLHIHRGSLYDWPTILAHLTPLSPLILLICATQEEIQQLRLV